jgi:hypothetical protein
MSGVYDILDEFSGELAAKLIAGSNDNVANQDAHQNVLVKLRLAYELAIDYYEKVSGEGWSPRPPLLAGPAWSPLPPLSYKALQSKLMLTCERTLEFEPIGATFSGWLNQKNMTDFISQEFTRAELARWLSDTGLGSVYPFAPKASQAEVEITKGQKVTDDAQAITAPKRPALLNNISHSTKTRRDTLTPVIELAQEQCRNPKDTAEVWAALLVLADKQTAPLIGATEDGLQYRKSGEVKIFSRDALRKRLAR